MAKATGFRREDTMKDRTTRGRRGAIAAILRFLGRAWHAAALRIKQEPYDVGHGPGCMCDPCEAERFDRRQW